MADAAYCHVQVIRQANDSTNVEQKTFPISPEQAELGVLSQEEIVLVQMRRDALAEKVKEGKA